MSDKLNPKRLAEITDNAAKYYTGKCQAETDVKDLLGHVEATNNFEQLLIAELTRLRLSVDDLESKKRELWETVQEYIDKEVNADKIQEELGAALNQCDVLEQERDAALQSVGSKVVQVERLVIERDHLRSTAIEQAETVGKLRNEVATFEKERDQLKERLAVVEKERDKLLEGCADNYELG